jgi:mannose-6-phosphate isomerase
MNKLDNIFFLKNTIHEYKWGSKTVIQNLLNEEDRVDKYAAELWIGAHPKAPSLVSIDSEWIPLDKFIKQNQEDILGESIAHRFSGQLPFLFKIIAVEKPLSLQVHPNFRQAKKGFSRENRQGIPVKAPERSYRDPSHKPELISPLTQFDALIGFRSIDEIENLKSLLCPLPGSNDCFDLERLGEPGQLKQIFKKIFCMNAEKQVRIIDNVVRKAESNKGQHPIFSYILRLHNEYPEDVCSLAPIFLNLVTLKPDQAMYVRSCEIHTYLHGAAVELMASSDNVIRAGLTGKHVNTDEFLETANFTPGEPVIMNASRTDPCETMYPLIFEEFKLSVISIRKGVNYSAQRDRSVEIIICTEGEARIQKSNGESLRLRKGDSVIIPAAVSGYSIYGNCKMYKASVPMENDY